MTIPPDGYATMLPILDVLSDGGEHIDDDIQQQVALHFRVTEEESRELQRNSIPVYENRTAWGLVYLQDPKYLKHFEYGEEPWIEKTGLWNGREVYRITDAGIAARRRYGKDDTLPRRGNRHNHQRTHQNRSFTLEHMAYDGMRDLAVRNPDLFVRVTMDQLRKATGDDRSASALMAHRTRILRETGIHR